GKAQDAARTPPCTATASRLRTSFFFFSSRRRHTRFSRDWSSDVCSSDLNLKQTSPFEISPTFPSTHWANYRLITGANPATSGKRSEERRVGKECRSRWRAAPWKKR